MRQFINLLQVIVMRGLMESATKEHMFSSSTVDTILCKWDTFEARLFLDDH